MDADDVHQLLTVKCPTVHSAAQQAVAAFVTALLHHVHHVGIMKPKYA